MKSIESAYHTLRNAEMDYEKNQIADPAVAEEMAYAEKDSHKKKMGIIKPSDEKLQKGQEAAFEKGVEVLAKEAEKIISDMKILEIQKKEMEFDGELISFEYEDHEYKINHFTSCQKEENVPPDYFQLVSVDGNEEFSEEDEKRVIQKFETALRMKVSAQLNNDKNSGQST
ncbi:MAG TPA: hypothetical protein DIC35_02750 [Candidatus Moranbacteria bacterium]|nr:hypothetical protein [Candidatus Moranbacteria bacterium]